MTTGTSIVRTRTVRAPRGTGITCKNWQIEAALRMLMNNLAPDVAEKPEELIIYGGSRSMAYARHSDGLCGDYC